MHKKKKANEDQRIFTGLFRLHVREIFKEQGDFISSLDQIITRTGKAENKRMLFRTPQGIALYD